MRLSLFVIAFTSYITNTTAYLDNLKYLNTDFFKLYQYMINYYNTIPPEIIQEYYMINFNLLKKMEKEGYKLIIVKNMTPQGYQLQPLIIEKPPVKIYHNDLKKYIKFYIPQNNFSLSKYKILQSNYIYNKLFLFYQYNNQLVMVVNFPLSEGCLINKNPIIKSHLEIQQKNNFYYLIMEQKQLFFIKNIQYRYKNNYLILKVYYGNKPVVKNHNPNVNTGIIVPNILNTKENLIFYPHDFSGKYFINEDNPKFISYNNLCNGIHEKKNKSMVVINNDIPFINYLFIAHNKGTHNQYFKEIENIYTQLKNTSDLKKDMDLFPTFPLDMIYSMADDNPMTSNYIEMISNFFYSKRKKFHENFKKFYKFNEFYIFYPFINDLDNINENLFWLMIYLLPFNKFSRENIVLLIKYSYGFPGVIRDKINSFIIYNLYLQKQFFIINYIFENQYINYTLDFLTNLIYVETKTFNGITQGKDLFELKFHKDNLLESTLIIQKLLYKKRKNFQIQDLIKDLKNILDIYKNYKIILTKENESQLFNLLSYLGQFNYQELEQLSQDAIINLNLVINYIKINNPKKYHKYYRKYMKIVEPITKKKENEKEIDNKKLLPSSKKLLPLKTSSTSLIPPKKLGNSFKNSLNPNKNLGSKHKFPLSKMKKLSNNSLIKLSSQDNKSKKNQITKKK